MVFGDGKLNKVYRSLIHIVSKCFKNIPLFVDHVQFVGNKWQQTSLQSDGKQDDDKSNVEQIVFRTDRT